MCVSVTEGAIGRRQRQTEGVETSRGEGEHAPESARAGGEAAGSRRL